MIYVVINLIRSTNRVALYYHLACKFNRCVSESGIILLLENSFNLKLIVNAHHTVPVNTHIVVATDPTTACECLRRPKVNLL